MSINPTVRNALYVYCCKRWIASSPRYRRVWRRRVRRLAASL